MTADRDALLAAIDAAKRDGVDAFDADDMRCIESLCERAATLGEAGASRLCGVAEARLASLLERYALYRLAAPAEVEHEDCDGALRESWAAGDAHASWLRKGMLSLRSPSRARSGAARRRWLDRLARRARDAGLPPPPEGAADPIGFARALSAAIAAETIADVRAALVVASARDALPPEVGPYNPGALGSRLLTALDTLSPRYLRDWVAAMEDVAALARLAPPPAPKPSSTPSRAGARRRASARAKRSA